MRRSNRPTRDSTRTPTGTPSRRLERGRAAPLLLILLLLFTSSVATRCRPTSGPRISLNPRYPGHCETVDSLLARSGWRTPFSSSGKATIDVEQYRVRGIFGLSANGRGDFTFAFESTTALGGLHEDLVFSYYGDTLRVLDRERGRYYEGSEIDRLVADGTGAMWDIADVVRRVMALAPGCDRIESVSAPANTRGDWVMSGRADGADFSVEFAGGRIRKADWPAIIDGRPDDRLRIEYEWAEGPRGVGDGLEKLVVLVVDRRWRVKLDAD